VRRKHGEKEKMYGECIRRGSKLSGNMMLVEMKGMDKGWVMANIFVPVIG
jgi:hypothetical protein